MARNWCIHSISHWTFCRKVLLFSSLLLLLFALEVLVVDCHGDVVFDDVVSVTSPPLYHRCVHDEVVTPYHALPRDNVTLRRFTASPLDINSNARQNMRFHAVFTFDKTCSKVGQSVPTYEGVSLSCTAADLLTPARKKALHSIIKAAFEFLSKALLVEPLSLLEVRANPCPYLETGAGSFPETDYVVFVTANPRKSQAPSAAWARWCVVDSVTGRPTVGHINFVPSAIREYPQRVDQYVAMHELTHALGFADIAKTAKSFVDASGVLQPGSARVFRENLGKEVTIIQTPRVVEVARQYFGCPTLDGVEVEDRGNSGTAGSHWKKRILFEEALVGVVTSPNLYYTSFTLAFLEDLGFYSVDYSVADRDLRWGRNKSCRFLYNKCNDQDPSVDEFCFKNNKKSDTQCTHDMGGAGACDVTEFPEDLPVAYQYFSDNKRKGGSLEEMDNCPFIISYSNVQCISDRQFDLINVYGSEFSPQSRCFRSNTITNTLPNLGTSTRCFPFTCTPGGQLLIRAQGQTAACPASGEAGKADTSHLDGIHGTIHCPAANILCQNADVSGVSPIISPNIDLSKSKLLVERQSQLNFASTVLPSCEERTKCAEELKVEFPSCRLTAQKIRECFGTDCTAEITLWSRKNKWPQKCANRKELAEECLDGWMGAHELCTLVSSSASKLSCAYSAAAIILVALLAIL